MIKLSAFLKLTPLPADECQAGRGGKFRRVCNINYYTLSTYVLIK